MAMCNSNTVFKWYVWLDNICWVFFSFVFIITNYHITILIHTLYLFYYAQNVNKTKTYFHQHVIFKELKFVVIDMYVTPLTKMPRWSIWTKSTLLKCGTMLVYYRLSLLHTCLHSIWRMINEMHILKNICVQIPKGIDL